MAVSFPRPYVVGQVDKPTLGRLAELCPNQEIIDDTFEFGLEGEVLSPGKLTEEACLHIARLVTELGTAIQPADIHTIYLSTLPVSPYAAQRPAAQKWHTDRGHHLTMSSNLPTEVLVGACKTSATREILGKKVTRDSVISALNDATLPNPNIIGLSEFPVNPYDVLYMTFNNLHRSRTNASEEVVDRVWLTVGIN